MEKEAWNQFSLVVKIFLGNNRSSSYESIVQEFLSSYKTLDARMSLKAIFFTITLIFSQRIWEELKKWRIGIK